MSDDLLQRLDAGPQIRNLIARLGHLADDGDLKEYVTLFTEDSGLDRPERRHALGP